MPARARTRSALAGDTGNAPAAPRPSYLEVPSDEEVLLEHVDGEGPRRVPRRLWGDFGPIAKLEPVRKIKKRSYKPVRPDARPCGRLSFPVEILSATFALLDHEGLDSLTRTNRALRSLLLTRATGLPIYRAVFANLFATGLPKPPLGLTLPAYASLLSIKTCTHCDATHNYTQGYYTVICFASRRRLCRECYQTDMVDLSSDAGKAEFPNLHLRVTQLVVPLMIDRPYRATHPRNGLLHIYSRDELEKMIAELEELDDQPAAVQYAHWRERVAFVRLRTATAESLNVAVFDWLQKYHSHRKRAKERYYIANPGRKRLVRLARGEVPHSRREAPPRERVSDSAQNWLDLQAVPHPG